MSEVHVSHRFPALYRAAEKMNPLSPASTPGPEPKPSRPVVTAAPIAWIMPAPPGSSPESRSLRVSRMRAVRELASGRQRVVQAVDRAHLLQQMQSPR